MSRTAVRADPPAIRASRRTATIQIAAGAIAAVLYSGFVLDWVLRGFSSPQGAVSLLQVSGQPNATLLRVADVLCAILVLAILPFVRRALPAGWSREACVWLTAMFAVGVAVASLVPLPCVSGVVCDAPGQVWQSAVHVSSSVVSEASLYLGILAAGVATRTSGPRWFRATAILLFVLGATLVVTFVVGDHVGAGGQGVAQRLLILCSASWILALSILAARHSRGAQC